MIVFKKMLLFSRCQFYYWWKLQKYLSDDVFCKNLENKFWTGYNFGLVFSNFKHLQFPSCCVCIRSQWRDDDDTMTLDSWLWCLTNARSTNVILDRFLSNFKKLWRKIQVLVCRWNIWPLQVVVILFTTKHTHQGVPVWKYLGREHWRSENKQLIYCWHMNKQC